MDTAFLKDLGERAANTFVQTLIGVLTVGPNGLNLFGADWKADLVAAVTATVVSVGKSLLAKYGLGTGTASLVKTPPAS